MKMSYDKAAADVILFNNSDIVTTSSVTYCAPFEHDGYWVEIDCEGKTNGTHEWVNGSNGNC